MNAIKFKITVLFSSVFIITELSMTVSLIQQFSMNFRTLVVTLNPDHKSTTTKLTITLLFFEPGFLHPTYTFIHSQVQCTDW